MFEWIFPAPQGPEMRKQLLLNTQLYTLPSINDSHIVCEIYYIQDFHFDDLWAIAGLPHFVHAFMYAQNLVLSPLRLELVPKVQCTITLYRHELPVLQQYGNTKGNQLAVM